MIQYDELYLNLKPEERCIVDSKVMNIWLCPELTDDMVKCVGFKLLEASAVNVIHTLEG